MIRSGMDKDYLSSTNFLISVAMYEYFKLKKINIKKKFNIK